MTYYSFAVNLRSVRMPQIAPYEILPLSSAWRMYVPHCPISPYPYPYPY